MKAISLWQPWATLMALDEKRIETRTRPIGYRGPLAICATKRSPIFCGALIQDEPFKTVLARHNINRFNQLPRACILCIVDLYDCVPVEELRGQRANVWPEHELEFGNFSVSVLGGPYAWLTRNVRPLKVPLPVIGQRGLFEVVCVCRVCGCTDECACEGGCSRIEFDLCSRCVDLKPLTIHHLPLTASEAMPCH